LIPRLWKKWIYFLWARCSWIEKYRQRFTRREQFNRTNPVLPISSTKTLKSLAKRGKVVPIAKKGTIPSILFSQSPIRYSSYWWVSIRTKQLTQELIILKAFTRTKEAIPWEKQGRVKVKALRYLLEAKSILLNKDRRNHLAIWLTIVLVAMSLSLTRRRMVKILYLLKDQSLILRTLMDLCLVETL